MKTHLPESIQTVCQAEQFLRELNNNSEVFHPEDNAHDIVWQSAPPTPDEADRLNRLMDDIYELSNFDPCEYLLTLNQ